MRRLYLQIYLAVVAILLLFTVLAWVVWIVVAPVRQDRPILEGTASVLGELLPTPGEPNEVLVRAVEDLGKRFSARLTVRSPEGTLLAAFGDPLPPPRPGREESGWMRSRGAGPTIALHLPDGRWLVARFEHEWRAHALAGLTSLGLLAIAIALGSYPIARRLAGRLERLQTRVDRLGAGDLSARVEIEGRDEVADLARSFNRAADRIERLVNAQRTALASASHELRTPLTRIRMAVELLAGEERAELRARVDRDIAELDELIGELLLASRLDALEQPVRNEEVDLLALVAEEAARAKAEVSGTPERVTGDSRMLRRLVRNLLENARRYGGGSRIDASVGTAAGGKVRLCIADRGPGVPEQECERIFEPFYRAPGMRESDDGGVGLGLALVRQIAQHHGGEARCLSREGGGTLFEILLPAAKPAAGTC
jgi:signal transduction histidine kinase